jgi:hypothetical protein
MSYLFKVPDRLPDVPAKVPMFRATQFASLSSRDATYQRALAKRTSQAIKLFDLKGEPANQGERILVRDGSQSLEIYCASDSLWWANHDLSYSEGSGGGVKLPSEAEAKTISKRELERAKLDVTDATMSSVTYTEASTAGRDQKPKTQRTAIDVNYSFSLAELPVFGPGAKIKVSVADAGKPAQVIYFWRRPKRAGSMATIRAGDALERFQRDPAFFRLRDTNAVIEIGKVDFGYYALSPTDFQRFYVPVFAVDATVRTREFPQYDLRRYVVAVDLSAESAKAMDALANPAACRMF